MSAWMCNRAHIDVLVTAGIALGLMDKADANELGEKLQRENVRSLQYRYGPEAASEFTSRHRYGPEEASELEPYEFTSRPVEDLEYVFKQASCYAYQACEHPEWDTSEACAFVDALSDAIAARYGTDRQGMYELPGWERAPWGVDLDVDGFVIQEEVV